MLSLVTVSPVITSFHSCCLSHHVFDQVNLWPVWVGFETANFWQCSPGTVETQRLYPLRHGPRRAIKDGFFFFFWSYNPYLVFHSRVRTEFLSLSLIGIILRWRFLIHQRLLNSPEVKFGRNVVKEKTTQKKLPRWGQKVRNK